MLLNQARKTNWKQLFVLLLLGSIVCFGVLLYLEKISQELDFPDYPWQLKMHAEEGKAKEVYLDFFEKEKEKLLFEKSDFLEINLEKMNVSLYKKGELINDFPVLTKGDPQNWGGSAVGLYSVVSGNELSYSIVSDVYMPYSLHYYGKYYLHGQPYYPDGGKLDTPISGGCLRLSDKDAKTIYYEAELGMPVLIIDKEKDDYKYSFKDISDFPNVSAESYLVADIDSGYVFAEKDSQAQKPLASVTKLMTAIVVSENIDLRKSIMVQEKMLESYGYTEVLEPGKRFRVVELFYLLLVESSNDAAEILSYFLGPQRTIEMMNEKAKTILMEKTSFSDPSGLDPENVSTAQDLFYLGRYLLNNRPPILEITKGEQVRSFGGIGFDIENLWSKNIFIGDETFIGGKTGFTKVSKYTSLFLFRFTDKDGKERNIAITLLGSDDNRSDTQKIYIWLQKNYFTEG